MLEDGSMSPSFPQASHQNAASTSTSTHRLQQAQRARNPQKRRRESQHQQAVAQSLFPSPPRSKSTPEKRRKRRRKTQEQTQAEAQARSQAQVDPLRPPRFWDSLTRVPLVRSALQELDRRNDAIAVHADPELEPTLETDLLRCARHGGPDLSSLRGAEEIPRVRRRRGSGSRRSTRRSSQQTKSSSPYDAAFKQHLIDWKVWPVNHYFETGSEPDAPDNMQDLKELCNISRASLEPDAFGQEDHHLFRKAYHLATSEESQCRTLDIVEGAALSLSCAHVKRGPVKLSNLRPLLRANFVPGNPDRAYGARPGSLRRSIRDRLGKLILPTAAQDILCPNFIVHIKGPGGRQETAGLQAVYDGALAARGMEALWAYGNEDEKQECANVARCITCTIADGILRMFAVARRYHGGDSPSEDVDYITTRLGTWAIVDEMDGFRRGAAAFRNGLEWARRQRDEAIERANKKSQADPPDRGSQHDGRPGSSCSEYQSSADPIV